MDDLKIRLSIEGADLVESGAKRAASGLSRLNVAGAEAGQKMQLSGQQLAQVSNQLQDFFIQIQGGQAPLTAFLQQGSQMSAMFGGIGNAARATVGAIVGLFTPLTVAIGGAVAAVGSLGLAYNQGSKEADAYARSLILSGNAAGTTVGQLQALARAQAEVVGTQSEAAEALAKLAASGKVMSAELDATGKAAVRFSRVGGDLDATIDKFVKLGDKPLKALIELNEAENFLTESTYRQVKALTEQGRQAEAAAVAQRAYAGVVSERSEALEARLGSLERAWKGVGDFAKGAWDKMLNVGRPVSLQDQLKDVQAQIAAAQAKIAQVQSAESQRDRPFLDVGRIVAAQTQLIEVLKSKAEVMQESIRLDNRAAEQQAAQVAGVKAIIKADDDAAKAKKSLNAEREREAAALERAVGLSGSYYEELARLYRLWQVGLNGVRLSQEQYVAAVDKLTKAQPFMREQLEAQADAQKKAADALREALKAEQQRVDAIYKSAAGMNTQVQKLLDEEQALALSTQGNISLASALELVRAARLKEAQAKATASQDYAAAAALRAEIDAAEKLAAALAKSDAAKSLREFLDPQRAETFGEALGRAFDGAGNSLAKLGNLLGGYARQQAEFARQAANIQTAFANDPAKQAAAQLKLNERAQRSQIDLYASMAGAAKGFFNENSRGYKALEAAETAFRVAQIASNLAQGLSAAAVGVANQAKGDTYTAFPRMAAMAAAMAAIGFAVAGVGGGGSSAPASNAGTGTVLGDSAKASDSIANAIEQLRDNSRLELGYSQRMLAQLQALNANISGLASIVVRGGTVEAATSGISLKPGASVSDLAPAYTAIGAGIGTVLLGPGLGTALGAGLGAILSVVDSTIGKAIPIVGKALSSVFGGKQSIQASGLYFGSTTLAQAASGGAALQTYADIKTDGGWFRSDKYSTQFQAADAQLQDQFAKVFAGLSSAMSAAAVPLGLSADAFEASLNSFVVNIGRIDLKDLSGEQIQEKLLNVLGAEADRLATALLPGLTAFQQVGEGYFETVVRVASGVETAQVALRQLGVSVVGFGDVVNKQGDVAAEIVRQSIVVFETAGGSLSSVGDLIANFNADAADLATTYKALVDVRDVMVSIGTDGNALTAALLQGAGGLDALASSLQTYLGGPFFTDQERAAAAMSTLGAQFARIGIQDVPQSYAAFRELVDGIDKSTEAGQRLYGQVLGLSGAFRTAQELAEAAGTAVTAAASRLPDILKSQASEVDGLLVELLRAQGDGVGAAVLKRAQDLAALTAGLSATEAAAATAGYDYIAGLREQITTLNTAAQAASQAATAEAQRTAAIVQQRVGLQDQLDQLVLTNEQLLAKQRAALDESNRALFDQVQAATAAKTAAEQLAQAQADAAQAEAQRVQAIAQQRVGLQDQLDQLVLTNEQLLAKQRAALDESNRALFDQVQAATAAKTAAEQLAQAQADAAQAEAQRVQAIAQQRVGLQDQLDQLTLTNEQLLAKQRAALDESNRALFDQVQAATAAKAAQEAANQAAQEAARVAEQQAQAAEQLRDAWRSIGDTLLEEAQRILGLAPGGSNTTVAQAQARFAIATGQARAGDQDAAKLLPDLSRTLLELAGDTVGSRAELDRVRAQVAASLQATAGVLGNAYGFQPQAGGADVPALLAQIAATAPITNAAAAQQQTAAAAQDNLAALVGEVRALRGEVQQLKDSAARTTLASERTRDVLVNVTEGGRAMQVETAS